MLVGLCFIENLTDARCSVGVGVGIVVPRVVVDLPVPHAHALPNVLPPGRAPALDVSPAPPVTAAYDGMVYTGDTTDMDYLAPTV